MSNDFWAGYLSGAIGIVIGNPLDVLKVRLQASSGSAASATSAIPTSGSISSSSRATFESAGALVRGAAAPILTYGALNALLFTSYNRTLTALSPGLTDPTSPTGVALSKIFTAGAVGGLVSWVVSSPTELVKCRAQLQLQLSAGSGAGEVSSWGVAREILRGGGVRGLYWGGGVTVLRDAVGYGFYFWSYELCKRLMSSTEYEESPKQEALKILLCGGIAGIVTWASVFPLDVVKTRLQAQRMPFASAASTSEQSALLGGRRTQGAVEIAREAVRKEGWSVFYRGLGVCSLRAFIVNAVQWATYEWIMKALSKQGEMLV